MLLVFLWMKKITQLIGTMESRILHSQTVPRNDSVYLNSLAFTEVFLLGDRAGFLKQHEWVLERRKSSLVVKPLSV